MIAGLALLLVANAGVTLAAAALARRVETPYAEERFTLALLFRFALIMVFVVAAGLGGILGAWTLGLAGAALLLLLLARGEHRGWPAPRRPQGVPFLVLAVAGFFAIRTLGLVWVHAPFEADVVCYHLPLMAEWIQTGRLLGEVGNDPRSWFPAGFQLVEAWWVVFLRHDVLIEMAGVEFLLLLFGSILTLARRLGLDAREAWIAALLGTATPAALMQAVSAFNDLPAAALVVAAAALVVGRAPLPILFLLAGVAAGLKPSAVYAAPGLVLLAWLRRGEPRRPSLPRPFAAGCCAAALLVGGVWYARNAAFHGNPLYPMGSSAFMDAWGEEPQKLGVSWTSFRENVSALANERVPDHRRPYQAVLQHISGWGPGIFAVGLPALVAALLTHPPLRSVAAALGLSVASVLALVVPDAFNARFVLFFTAVPALAAGTLSRALPAVSHAVVGALGVVFFSTMVTGAIRWESLRDNYVAKPWRERWSGHRFHPIYPEPPRVATYGSYATWGYAFYRPDFSVRVVHLKSRTPERLMEEIRRHDVRRVYMMGIDRPGADRDTLLACVEAGWLRRTSEVVFERVNP